MSAEDEARYEEILRRIENRKQVGVDISRQASLAGVLDSLNAMGFLDDLGRRRIPGINLYGPKGVKGIFQTEADKQPSQWAGAVLWYKPRGYHHYRTLTLMGIWAIEATEGIDIIIGQKPLKFDAPVFNPESYYRHLKQKYELYYPDDGGPPPEDQRLYGVLYDAGQRLATREAMQGVLDVWRKQFRHIATD